ncbi:MAG: VTT domain-containing protein [Candidatus Thiodiazotropha weberae]|nr:VTT domain-containing protein [Candidatus Thiodiazotropha lotti]MCW4209158.1 VTT domain-containing protein [Candidatus Thiodiazotropha lotti]
MKSLLKIMLLLALFFASTFIILKSTGIITVEKIELWLEMAKNSNPVYVAVIVVGLLFADLFVAVPTLTVMILGGYFLGPVIGALAAISGLFAAGVCGYGISWKYGDILMRFLIKDKQKRVEAKCSFKSHGGVVILLSRAVPILPEVSACMAGMTRMPFLKFLVFWMLSAVPYAFIAAYAGSISTLENPTPAILTMICLTSFFLIGWYIFRVCRR